MVVIKRKGRKLNRKVFLKPFAQQFFFVKSSNHDIQTEFQFFKWLLCLRKNSVNFPEVKDLPS